MTNRKSLLLLPILLLVSGCTDQPVMENPTSGFKPVFRRVPEWGLISVYPEERSFQSYVNSHPCVAGEWFYKSETETHWIGALSYPTQNTDPAGARYWQSGVRIAKRPGLTIDLSQASSGVTSVVLLKPAKDTDAYELVAYSDPAFKDSQSRSHLLFSKHPALRYQTQSP